MHLVIGMSIKTARQTLTTTFFFILISSFISFSSQYFPVQSFCPWISKEIKATVSKNSLTQPLLISLRSKSRSIFISNLCFFLRSSPLLWIHAFASILFSIVGIIVAYLYTNATRYYAKEELVNWIQMFDFDFEWIV